MFITIYALIRTVYSFAASKNKAGQLTGNHHVKHINHPQNIDRGSPVRTIFDFCTHQVGEMNDMSNIWMRFKNTFNRFIRGDSP